MTSRDSPRITSVRCIPVAGHDSMLLNLSGAHGPFFTRNLVIVGDDSGHVGVGEVPGGAGDRTGRRRRARAARRPFARRAAGAARRGRTALRRPRYRRPRRPDLRSAHDGARRRRPRVRACSICSASISACRCRRCSARAVSARACRCSAICSMSAIAARAGCLIAAAEDGDAWLTAARRSGARREGRSFASPKRRTRATALPTSS